MSRTAAYRGARRYAEGGWAEVERAIPEEAPVVIAPNGAPFAAVMASPADLEDLAVGFAVTERLVGDAREISSVEIMAVDEGYEARLAVPTARSDALAERRRAFAARTSCSLCGLEDLDLLLAGGGRVSSAPRMPPERIVAAMAAMPAAQVLAAESHGVHAAGWAAPDGTLGAVREDVGRHNALDKLIGNLLRDERDPAAGAICLTSRCSIEMVLKAATVGVGLVVAASSPTELAVRAAHAAGVTLVAGVRSGAFDVYAHAERLEQAL